MDKIIDWIYRHKLIIVIICFVVIMGIPLLIHACFVLPAPIECLEAKWSAGDLLNYYGVILTFISTTILSVAALRQTVVLERKNAVERSKIRIYVEKETPFFISSYDGKTDCNLRFDVNNILEEFPLYVVLSKMSIKRCSWISEKFVLKNAQDFSMGYIAVKDRNIMELSIHIIDCPDIIKMLLKKDEVKHYRMGLMSEEEFFNMTGS